MNNSYPKMNNSHPDPVAVTQDVLNRVSAALLVDDDATFTDGLSLPYTMQLLPDIIMINDSSHLQAIYRALRSYITVNQVTDFDQHCTGATYTTDDEITASYESRYLVGTRLLPQRTIAIIRLRREAAIWRVFEGNFTFRDTPQQLIDSLKLPPPASD
ncbi:hypothetical protein SAMN05444339_101256 [Loktanella atrilutea]|uniref:SnoaL-like domain-containing protein n=2 Tax=Loktanella atrilutea TaxID=366533 RepID=A0A1M4T5A1_LOKAT|nr:hypothetical protein SAMN05444339_101256 [Loktanella atrilutea]